MDEDKVIRRATNNAYALLRQRPRSEYEVRSRLKAKGYGQDVIERVVAGLVKAGEIDDPGFARLWMESRMDANPVGDVILRHELKLKGVSDDIIEATLRLKRDNYDERKVAFEMASERFERFKRLDRAKAAKRIYDFMARRGFKFDTIQSVIEELIHEDR